MAASLPSCLGGVFLPAFIFELFLAVPVYDPCKIAIMSAYGEWIQGLLYNEEEVK